MELLPLQTIHKACKNLSQTETSHEQYKSYWGNLNEQRKDGVLCDVLIQCGSHSYHAHKCVLAAASPYFKALFSSPISHTNNQQIVNFDNYSKETIQLLLCIVYGEYTVESVDFAEILLLAEFLQYDWLLNIVVESIRTTIDDTNCFSWHKIGEECGVRKLVVLAESYIAVNYNSLITSEGHGNMASYVHNFITKRESVLTKDIIVYYSCDSFYAVDISKKSVEKYVDAPCKLTKVLPERPPDYYCDFSFFMYKKELFLVSLYELEDEYRGLYSDTSLERDTNVLIYKYNHCSQEYQEVHSISTFELLHVLRGDNFFLRRHYHADVVQFVYNNLNSLYILCCDNEDKNLLYRFDLAEGVRSPNYLMLNIETNNLSFVESKHIGTLLINGIEQAYNLEKFNFDESGSHSLDPLNIKPGWQSKAKDSRRQIKLQNLLYEAWEAVSVSGEIYFFAVFQDNKEKLSVLHLNINIDELSWVYLCDFPISGDLRNVFSYHDKIYVAISSMEHDKYCSCGFEKGCYLEELNIPYRKEAVFNCLYYFDHDKETLTDMDIKLPSTEGSYMFSVIPAHLLI